MFKQAKIMQEKISFKKSILRKKRKQVRHWTSIVKQLGIMILYNEKGISI